MLINKINVNLTTIVSHEPLSDVPCGTCTLCCEVLSPHLTPEEATSGKYPISLVQPSEDILRLDPDVGPIITMFKAPHGGCSMFIDGKCSIYEDRPIACKQFDCRKKHHPKTNNMAREKFGMEIIDE